MIQKFLDKDGGFIVKENVHKHMFVDDNKVKYFRAVCRLCGFVNLVKRGVRYNG